MLGLHWCARAFSSCGVWASHSSGFSCCRAWALGAGASVVVAGGSVLAVHRFSCFMACGIILDQGSNPRPLQWQDNQGSPLTPNFAYKPLPWKPSGSLGYLNSSHSSFLLGPCNKPFFAPQSDVSMCLASPCIGHMNLAFGNTFKELSPPDPWSPWCNETWIWKKASHLAWRISDLYWCFDVGQCGLVVRVKPILSLQRGCACSVVSDSLQPHRLHLPGSSVHGIFQARALQWVAISFSRGSSWPRDWTHVSCTSCIGRHILYHWAT